MSFTNPLLLLGLLGALVPIIIHLIHKRRPRQQPFSAIELLIRSIERVERKWRIKRILLLASRCLLLAALAIAAAGPLLGASGSLAQKSTGPSRLAIVIDASLSMRASYNETTAFQQAVMEARNLIDAMGPEDQAVLVAAKASPELLLPRPTASRAQLLSVLEELSPGFGHADIGEAVTTAARALGSLSSKQKDKPSEEKEDQITGRVVLLSDLAQHAFSSPADLSIPGTTSLASLEVLDVVGDVGPRQNQAITAIDANNIPGRAPRTVEFKTRIQSFSPTGESAEAIPLAITLRSQDKDLELGSIDVVPGTIVDKVMQHAFDQPGHMPVSVHLEADALKEDNVRFAVVDVRRQVRTLVVDGAPSGVPKEDEIFYLERALMTGARDQPPPRVIPPDDLSRADFSRFDVILLAGVASFSRGDAARLVEFVEQGGGLLISASEDMDIELYNAELTRILPRPLRGLKIVDPESGGVGSSGIVTLANPATTHPILEVFEGEAAQGLLSTRTRAYVLLQPGGTRAMNVLVEHEDGQPALVEGKSGKGRVIFLTTSIDRDLTDLPIRPAFVPLLRRAILHLGNALAKPDERRTTVSEVRKIAIPPRATLLQVIRPDGVEATFGAGELTGVETISYKDTAVTGHYEVQVAFAGPPEPLPTEHFAVNPDTRESNLVPLPVKEARAILLGTTNGTESSGDSVLARARALTGTLNPETLAGILLLVMLLSFLAESFLSASRIGR